MNKTIQLIGAFLCISVSFNAVGSSTCYGNVTPSHPNTVYLINGDGTVTDRRTGLTWKQCSEGQVYDNGYCFGLADTYTWSEALELSESNSDFAGNGDWRLPNAKELFSLVELCAIQPSINGSVFPNTPSSAFWTSSPVWTRSTDERDQDLSWVVHFNGGSLDFLDFYTRRTFSNHVRLVRDDFDFDNGSVGDDPTKRARRSSLPVWFLIINE